MLFPKGCIERVINNQKINDTNTHYKQTKQNPVYFPGEENILRVTRINSYRHTHGGKDHGNI